MHLHGGKPPMSKVLLASHRWLDRDGPPGAALLVTFMLAALAYAFWIISRAVLGTESLGPVQLALTATLGTAVATGLCAVPVLMVRGVSTKLNDGMLGFSAGVMLAASVFSLILPALEAAQEITGSRAASSFIAMAGVALGGLLLLLMDRSLPHEHPVQGREGPLGRVFARMWLFVFAITLHNVPEGLAVGVGLAGDDPLRGLPLALGIGVQNMPEGLAVALAMLTLGYPPSRAVLIALLTGLVEPVGGFIGSGVVTIAQNLLPWGLAFAAGAMLFIISHEIIPESHRNGHQTFATIGLFTGFLVMMGLDTALH
jgi:ZIP family zinc transporter